MAENYSRSVNMKIHKSKEEKNPSATSYFITFASAFATQPILYIPGVFSVL